MIASLLLRGVVPVLLTAAPALAQVAPPPPRQPAQPSIAPPARPAESEASPAPAAIDPRLPSIESLKQQLAAGENQEVLRTVAKLLALKGQAAQAYDRYELLMLRGEASLRNKAMPMASEAFKMAQQETDDADKQAAARAIELLVRKSKQTGYVPKLAPTAAPGAQPAAGTPREQIPIIDEADRKQAFAALLNDELSVLEPKVKASAKATSLAPIVELARALADLRAVEVAAGEQAQRTKSIGSMLGARAHELIAGAMDGMDRQVEEIWDDASQQRYSRDRFGYVQRNYGMKGMNSMQAKTLKDVVVTCEKIVPVARDLAMVTEGSELQTDAKAAETLYNRARQVLEFDYANEGRDTSKSQGDPRRDRERIR